MSGSLRYAGFCWSVQAFETWVTFWMTLQETNETHASHTQPHKNYKRTDMITAYLHLQAVRHQKETGGERANVEVCGEREG